MEEVELKKYLYNLNKMIKSENPKFISCVSREYMKNQSNVISEAIRDMIFNEVHRNTNSLYSIFLDKDGSINLENMSDISKISDLNDFIRNVELLSESKVDLSKVTLDDLTAEADELAQKYEEEAEVEIQKVEENANIQDSQNKVGGILAKLGIFATIGGVIGSSFRKAMSRIKGKSAQISNSNEDEKNSRETISSQEETVDNHTFDEICPKVDIDEKAAIENMKINHIGDNTKRKNTDTYGDGDPDGDDIDL